MISRWKNPLLAIVGACLAIAGLSGILRLFPDDAPASPAVSIPTSTETVRPLPPTASTTEADTPSSTAPAAALPIPPKPTPPVATSTPPRAAPAGPKPYTAAQVKAHGTAADCWTSVDGAVYDLTAWIAQHPGGESAITRLCGTDGSAAFKARHAGEKGPAAALAGFKIGVLGR